MTAKQPRVLTWRQFFVQHGDGFLRWLKREHRKVLAFDRLARGVEEVVVEVVRTHDDAIALVRAFPNVYGGNCPASDFNDRSNALAYLVAHMLERYSRTWDSLVELTRTHVLPMSRSAMRALDVGAGPGPAAYAIWDYYSALRDFLQSVPVGLVDLGEVDVHCCERGSAMVHLMAHLSEISRRPPYHAHFSDFRHVAEDVDRRKYVRDEDEPEYWSENDSLPEFYRLMMLSNFLTRPELLSELEDSLKSTLRAIRPGGLVVMMNGSGTLHQRIAEGVRLLADDQGLTRVAKLREVVEREYDDYCGWRTKSVYLAAASWLQHLGVTELDWKSNEVNAQIWNRQAAYRGSDSFSLFAFRKGLWPNETRSTR